MVQSGECTKYPLAVVSKLVTTFGDGLGGSTLGSQAWVLNHTCLVGAFHGHAHHWLRQLSHLTLYVEGLGLEDLETCESNFLFDNYKQALAIIHDSKTILPNLKHDLSIEDNNIFCRWPEEEKEYLEGLSCEPLEETLHMEYWQRLGKLEDLECKLSISWHWVPEDKEWQDAGRLVANQEYCCALDNLESLVVAWLFELTKMNREGTAMETYCQGSTNLFYSNQGHARPLQQDMCEDISQCPWAHLTACFTMDTYFKMHQAEEEIKHLNIKIHQVIISHLKHLHGIAILPAFSGTLHPGESALKGPVPVQHLPLSQPLHGDTHQDLEEEEEIEHEVEEASHTIQDVLEDFPKAAQTSLSRAVAVRELPQTGPTNL
ncbi:hypothetical protein EDD16DRAFT_1529100 [Pisolithus croceorrhizus]|nr:hypothetical protein EDD16DRAFT_1529100 [Pisolithus croceorrhizus]KAI6163848.1 hypothetical protein EDD17DRAFT_1507126 [Pisolithus thermaeus]